MSDLHEALRKHGDKNITSWHMPGHKRKLELKENPYSCDITEIRDFDNLHYSTGILKEEQKKAANLYGAQKTIFLVSGSTVGILTSIAAAVPSRGTLIMARNCHKSAYNGAYLRSIHTEYIFPEIRKDGLMGAISPKEVEAALCKCPDASAVFLTSPTYDGVVSDIEKIAHIVHEKNAILIVDAAHGAHFGFDGNFPQSPVKQGADLVIMSTHKTLPSPTQTALLHICSDRVDVSKIEKFFDCYETSSPSYLLMMGICDCLEKMATDSDFLFEKLNANLSYYYEKLSKLENLQVIRTDDPSKLIIKTSNVCLDGYELTGERLYNLLLDEFGQELEMATRDYVLAIATVMDERADFDRLIEALLEIDKRLCRDKTILLHEETVEYTKNDVKYDMYEALDMDTEDVSVDKCEKRVCAQWIYAYPPGIPVVVPGEIISRKLALNFARNVDKFYPIGYNNSVKVLIEKR